MVHQFEYQQSRGHYNSYEVMQEAQKHEYEDGLVGYTMQFGEKQVEVFFNANKHTFATFVKNTKERPISGSTSLLYTATKELMQEITDQLNEPTTYTMRTGSNSIIQWAMSDGKNIFDWDYSRVNEQDIYTFTKTFRPTAYEKAS